MNNQFTDICREIISEAIALFLISADLKDVIGSKTAIQGEGAALPMMSENIAMTTSDFSGNGVKARADGSR